MGSPGRRARSLAAAYSVSAWTPGANSTLAKRERRTVNMALASARDTASRSSSRRRSAAAVPCGPGASSAQAVAKGSPSRGSSSRSTGSGAWLTGSGRWGLFMVWIFGKAEIGPRRIGRAAHMASIAGPLSPRIWRKVCKARRICDLTVPSGRHVCWAISSWLRPRRPARRAGGAARPAASGPDAGRPGTAPGRAVHRSIGSRLRSRWRSARPRFRAGSELHVEGRRSRANARSPAAR